MAASLRKNSHQNQHLVLFLAVGCLLLQMFHERGLENCGVMAFTTSPSFQTFQKSSYRNGMQGQKCSFSSSSSSLMMSRIRTSVPSQAKCEELGVREWPQQSKKGSWSENVPPENSLFRYVLEGSGSLEIDDQTLSVTPGTLVEIQEGSPELRLDWTSDTEEMILLTPGFEEGGVFLGVIAGILVLFGVLLSGVLG
mmetsp:Transcript_13825/g.28533  ORF Transcript_13825/g.28533 Transcript_13825/m.28533 type:complete len:196 (+) Transcript_13825:154-741(+)